MPHGPESPGTSRAHTANARRTAHEDGLLARIAERRRQRDSALSSIAAAEDAGEDPSRHQALLRGAQQGLDAAVMLAVRDRKPPGDGAIALAAGIDAYELGHLRQQLGVPARGRTRR